MIKMTELKTGMTLIADMRGLNTDTLKLKKIMVVHFRQTQQGEGIVMIPYPPFIGTPETEIEFPIDWIAIPPYDPEESAIKFYKQRLEEERKRRSGIEVVQKMPNLN